MAPESTSELMYIYKVLASLFCQFASQSQKCDFYGIANQEPKYMWHIGPFVLSITFLAPIHFLNPGFHYAYNYTHYSCFQPFARLKSQRNFLVIGLNKGKVLVEELWYSRNFVNTEKMPNGGGGSSPHVQKP